VHPDRLCQACHRGFASGHRSTLRQPHPMHMAILSRKAVSVSMRNVSSSCQIAESFAQSASACLALMRAFGTRPGQAPAYRQAWDGPPRRSGFRCFMRSTPLSLLRGGSQIRDRSKLACCRRFADWNLGTAPDLLCPGDWQKCSAFSRSKPFQPRSPDPRYWATILVR
jgi:hypothetical protein